MSLRRVGGDSMRSRVCGITREWRVFKLGIRADGRVSLAAQLGDPEADMALSKWFLCGSEGAFDKDEALTVKYAEKVGCYLIL